jgi:pimeloyl-ACP methyl ester carboxylesterase
MKSPTIILMVFCLLATALQSASAQQATFSEVQPEMQRQPTDEPVGYPNWKTPTLGGQQFWTDVRHAGGWRIQGNSETGHYRLLDPKDVRHAYGNRIHCDQTLDRLIVDGQAKQYSGKVVIVLHGLIRTKNSMQPMSDYLHQHGDFTSINFQYASTRKNVGYHAVALKSVMESLGPQVTEIDFIGHSLGNIVVRRYLGDNTDPQTGQQGDPRLKRMVMLAPPNQGSKMARILKTSLLFKTIAGVSGSELSQSWDKLEPTLAIPAFEFGIIAGGQENREDLSNFVLKGKDDFTVSVEETKLAGAHDFLVQPLLHSTMMHQPEVLQASLDFLQKGWFESQQTRSPLPKQLVPQPAVESDRSSR